MQSPCNFLIMATLNQLVRRLFRTLANKRAEARANDRMIRHTSINANPLRQIRKQNCFSSSLEEMFGYNCFKRFNDIVIRSIA